MVSVRPLPPGHAPTLAPWREHRVALPPRSPRTGRRAARVRPRRLRTSARSSGAAEPGDHLPQQDFAEMPPRRLLHRQFFLQGADAAADALIDAAWAMQGVYMTSSSLETSSLLQIIMLLRHRHRRQTRRDHLSQPLLAKYLSSRPAGCLTAAPRRRDPPPAAPLPPLVPPTTRRGAAVPPAGGGDSKMAEDGRSAVAGQAHGERLPWLLPLGVGAGTPTSRSGKRSRPGALST
ncbi:hypothetical protein ZWY2020_006667 [Hordeum vulgare]|nr:hypothetical protein ZWY2020_006667 [Hordeum vulgare]